MKIQKGLVKYKERSDIICTYGITDDGKQYYFLNDTKLANNNIIVSTTLVEAVDPNVVKANVGVIDENGDIVIECVNRSIRLVTNNILLVERANPVSPSVVDAVKTRKDPLAATKLVSTPSVIKDKITAQMGDAGKFIFNDQFSEASLFDISGKNLLNDKYYSFIAINKKEDTIYLSYNTKESNVDVYTIATGELVDNNAGNEVAVAPAAEVPVEGEQVPVAEESVAPETPAPVEAPVPEQEPVAPIAPTVPEAPAQPEEAKSELQSLGTDVEPSVPVEASTPENAVLPTAEEMAAVQGAQPIDDNKYSATVNETVPESEVAQAEAQTPEVPLTDINPVQPEEGLVNVPLDATVGIDNPMPAPEGNALVNSEVPVEGNVEGALPEPEVPQESELALPGMPPVVEQEENTEAVNEIPVAPPVVEEPEETPTENQPVVEQQESVPAEEQPVEETPVEPVEEKPAEEQVVEEQPVEEEPTYEDVQKIEEESNDFETEEDSDIDKFLNGTDDEDDYEEKYEDMSIDTDYIRTDNKSNSNNIMDDAASIVSKLIETNKNQKDEIEDYRNQVKELNSINKKVVDKAKREKEKTKTSIQNYETEIEKLKSQMDDLENAIRDKESKLNSQQRELSDLREKLQGTQNLEKVLKDAESLLGN